MTAQALHFRAALGLLPPSPPLLYTIQVSKHRPWHLEVPAIQMSFVEAAAWVNEQNPGLRIYFNIVGKEP